MEIRKNKKTSFFAPFIIGFFVIITVMVIAYFRASSGVSLRIPPGGIRRLYTVGESLVAVLSENQLYIWKWDSIKGSPEKVSLPSGDSLWLPTGKLISVSVNAPDTIVITDVTAKRESKKFSIGYGWVLCNLNLSSNGQFIVAAFKKNINNFSGNNSYKNFCVVMLSEDFNDIMTIINLDKVEISDLAVSDDGRFIATVGRKNDVGWMAVTDVGNKEIIWQKDANETEGLTKIIFSPANDTIYAAGIGRTIYSFKVNDENLVGRFQMDEDFVAQKRQYISTMAVSNNDYFLGASTEPVGTIYIWNLVTGKRVYTGNSRMIITSGLAFSPDSSLFAVSDVQTNPIKIFKVPD